MEDRPWRKYWIKNFKQDKIYGHKRFKSISPGDIIYKNIDEALVDIVDLDTFIKLEEDRIPYFIGTQFGISPRLENIPGFFNGEKVIAILAKSQLSGTVAGLNLYQIGKDDTKFTHKLIVSIENTLPKDEEEL